MEIDKLLAENKKLKKLIQQYEKNCKIVADTTFKMSEMILNLKSTNEKLQFELDMEKWKNAEITNEDGSRNWEANILFDNVKRLEQENAELKAYKDVNEDFKTAWEELKAENAELRKNLEGYKNGIKKV